MGRIEALPALLVAAAMLGVSKVEKNKKPKIKTNDRLAKPEGLNAFGWKAGALKIRWQFENLNQIC